MLGHYQQSLVMPLQAASASIPVMGFDINHDIKRKVDFHEVVRSAGRLGQDIIWWEA